MDASTLFLLSPAHSGGRRAATLFRPEAPFDLAVQLRSEQGAPLGEVFSFLSGLYFRGKLAYARAFARPPPGLSAAFVITPGQGLLPPESRVGIGDLTRFASVSVDPREPRYTVPLQADLSRLAADLPATCRVVLLGSVATSKYVELLVATLGERICFPAAFVGVGDMARGAIMLRAVDAGAELPYVTAVGAVRSVAGRRSPSPGAAGRGEP